MKYNHEEIYNIIPNRYPLMFIDSLETGENSAIANINLNDDTWFFACHYPDNPIMPLSLLVESMTQTFSSTFLSKMTDEKEIPVISSLSEIRLRDSVVPGDRLKLEASLLFFRRGVAKGICKAYKNEGKVPICEIEIVETLPSQMVKMR